VPGFACVITENIDLASFDIKHKSLAPVTSDKKAAVNYCAYRFSNNKFLHDKIFTDDDEIFVITEGVILNLKQLQLSNGCQDYFTTIKKMYQKEGDEFFKSFRGAFSGLLYDKIKRKWLVFTGHTGSKPVFYFKNEHTFICASELQLVTQILKKLGYKYSLDNTGSYFLLTFGFMLEDYTLIEQVKRLKPGHYIKIEYNKAQVNVYNVFNNDVQVNHSREEIIDNLETLFKKSVTLEYEKDTEYGYKHLASLSGGLDTRMSVMTARELGYDNILNVTFSQSDYWDEKIAKKIASDLGNEFLFYALDNGNFLKSTITDAVIANGGLVLYSGAAHELSSFRNINMIPFGMQHSGQLGDAVLGSYLSKPGREKPQLLSGAYSSHLSDKISSVANKVLQNYESEEIFKLYNRGFNGIVNGDWMVNQFTESCSPFLDVDFLRYTLSIPPALKFKEQIYHEWILTKRPAAAKYVWERTRAKLTTSDTIVKAKQFVRKVRFKLLGQSAFGSMNPFHYWYRTNAELRRYMEDYFYKHIYVLDDYPELKSDCKKLFDEGHILEKTQAMTLLEAVKLHFH
jgi:asparagine synthase (glutamine-hydrolysing)